MVLLIIFWGFLSVARSDLHISAQAPMDEVNDNEQVIKGWQNSWFSVFKFCQGNLQFCLFADLYILAYASKYHVPILLTKQKDMYL